MQALIWATVFNCAANGAALGRLAVRELRGDQRADLLKDVAGVQGLVLDERLLKAIKRKAAAISERRNLLAHGIWTFRPDVGWMVKETRGAWEGHPEGPTGKRSITPQSIPMSDDEVRRTVAELEDLIADAEKLGRSLRKPVANGER
jgi:hypothetical protein